MNIVSLASIFLIYVVLFLSLERPWLLATLGSYALLFLAIAALHSTFTLYGYEIVGNFFFAQVVGEAAFLAILLALSGYPRRPAEIVLLPALVFFMGWIFPLAQIKLAIGCVVLWALNALQDWLRTKRLDWSNLACVALLCLLSFAAIVFHPEFDYFRKVAEHEGGNNQTISQGVIAVFAGLLFFASLALLALAATGNLGLLRPAFIPAAGLASVVAYLAQALLHFGWGIASDYAVRKHAYALTTLLAVAAIALVMEAVTRRASLIARYRMAAPLGDGMAIAAALVTVLLLISHYAEGRRDFLAYQREIRGLPALASETLSLDRDFPPEFNLAISVVDLKLAPELAPFHRIIMGRTELKNPVNRYPHLAIVSRSAVIDPTCIRHEPKLSLGLLVDYGCNRGRGWP
jgi:hypothetical protein